MTTKITIKILLNRSIPLQSSVSRVAFTILIRSLLG